jgi:hypothetical protein
MKKPLYREALTPKNRPFPQYLSLRKREDVVFSLRGDSKGDVHSSYEGDKVGTMYIFLEKYHQHQWFSRSDDHFAGIS